MSRTRHESRDDRAGALAYGPDFDPIEQVFAVRLFADPAGLDRGGELLEGRVGGQGRKVDLALARAVLLAHQLDGFPGQVLIAFRADPLGRTIGHPDP